MNIAKVDLNLLVYMDVLLAERNVTRAADKLGITQPAMSNVLKRLRTLFNDPLLVRTSDGMLPTERALDLAPLIHEAVTAAERAVQLTSQFNPASSSRVFRISASDYAESALLPTVLGRLQSQAPDITLDILTPSDVGVTDVELAKVDMVINRFTSMPQSFHQRMLWTDGFSCLMSRDNPILDSFDLDAYLTARHVWVSKTGMGVGVGMNPRDVQSLGWVDEELRKNGHQRHIAVFTRHYQVAMLFAEQPNLVVTLPSRAASLMRHNPRVVIRKPPFEIAPIELSMAWSPLMQHNAAHKWLRELIVDVATTIS